MLEPTSTWKQTLKALPQLDNGSWPSKIAGWLDERATTKLKLQPVQGGMVQYTFNRAVFEAQLSSFTPVDTMAAAHNRVASAWAAAVSASLMVISPGSSLLAPSPATTWSVVATVVNPASVLAARALLFTKLMAGEPVDDGGNSHMPEAFRSAFLALTFIATGMNSLPIPTPLVSPVTTTM